MSRAAVAVLIVAIAAAIVLLRPTTGDEGPRVSENNALTALEERIDEQQRQLDLLRQQVEAIAATLGVEAPADNSVVPNGDLRQAPGNVPRASVAALVEAGLTEFEARRVFEFVRDHRSAYSRQFAELASSFQTNPNHLRESIEAHVGSHAYDGYLFASGQRNRLRVAKVFEGSSAASNGVEVGDVLYALDGRRVFNPGDVHSVQSTGGDELVELQLLRGGELLSFFLPKDRLGVQLSSFRIKPDH